MRFPNSLGSNVECCCPQSTSTRKRDESRRTGSPRVAQRKPQAPIVTIAPDHARNRYQRVLTAWGHFSLCVFDAKAQSCRGSQRKQSVKKELVRLKDKTLLPIALTLFSSRSLSVRSLPVIFSWRGFASSRLCVKSGHRQSRGWPQGQRSLTRFSDEHLGQVLVVPAAAAAFHDEAVSAWMLFQ